MTSGGRSMCSSAIRPSSGTGHSTRPATSSSRPGSSTTVSCFSAARPAMPSAMMRLRSAASTSTRCARSLSRPVGGSRDGEGAGGVEAVALGQVAAGEAVAVIGAVAQVERHDRAVQQADDAAQRADPGEVAGAAPAHRFRPGEAAEDARYTNFDQMSGGYRRMALFRHPETVFLTKLLSGSVNFAQESWIAGSGAPTRGPRCGYRPRPVPRSSRRSRRRNAPGTVKHLRTRMASDNRFQADSDQPGKILGCPSLHARWDFLAEQFEEEFGHQISPSVPARRRSGRNRRP